jgi:hypothetical protein
MEIHLRARQQTRVQCATQRGSSKKKKFFFFFLVVVARWKREEKNVQILVFNPQDPQAPRAL